MFLVSNGPTHVLIHTAGLSLRPQPQSQKQRQAEAVLATALATSSNNLRHITEFSVLQMMCSHTISGGNCSAWQLGAQQGWYPPVLAQCCAVNNQQPF